jgi:hypothetical protein
MDKSIHWEFKILKSATSGKAIIQSKPYKWEAGLGNVEDKSVLHI